MGNTRATRNFIKFGMTADGSEVTSPQHQKIVADLLTAGSHAPTPPAPSRQPPQAQAPVKKRKHAFLDAYDAIKLESGFKDPAKVMSMAIQRHPDLYKNFMEQGQRR